MTLKAFNIQQTIQLLQQSNLLRHTNPTQSGVTPLTKINTENAYINFSSNDYLGLSSHPALTDAILTHLKTHGVGAGASHLVTGHTSIHEQLQMRIAAYAGYDKALLFSSGYMANIGVVDALMHHTKQGVIYQDRLNHASLLDGGRLSGVKNRRFQHQDYSTLNDWLKADHSIPEKLIISDQVFSMDGTEADTNQLIQLANTHHAGLMIDDAHGFGLRTNPLPKVDVYMATFGKALGTSGAFIAGSVELITYLTSMARTFGFSTATPPLIAAATIAALDVIQTTPTLLAQLQKHIYRVKQALAEQNWHTTNSNTAIQPIIVGTEQRAIELSNQLKNAGIIAIAIRPPTVPTNTSRVRISLSAAHTDDHIDHLIETLRTIRPLF